MTNQAEMAYQALNYISSLTRLTAMKLKNGHKVNLNEVAASVRSACNSLTGNDNTNEGPYGSSGQQR